MKIKEKDHVFNGLLYYYNFVLIQKYNYIYDLFYILYLLCSYCSYVIYVIYKMFGNLMMLNNTDIYLWMYLQC